MSDPLVCKLKKKCPNKSDDLFYCMVEDCSGWIHAKCCDLLLDKYNVKQEDRPTPDEKNQDDQPIVFCKLECQKKWTSAKKRAIREEKKAEKEAAKGSTRKRIPWEDDGTMPVLMEFLTTEGNYARCCGANGNKGKSKAQHHKEIASLIKEKVPNSNKTEKNASNKTETLERTFREAHDWAGNTGAGDDATPGDFERGVLSRCPYHYDLMEIMLDVPNAAPLFTNEDKGNDDNDPLGLDDDTSSIDTNLSTDVTDVQAIMDANENPPSSSVKDANNNNNPPSSESKGRKRLTASSNSKPPSKRGKKSQDEADQAIATLLGGGSKGLEELRTREVVAQEQIASARMIEATANANEANREASVLTIDEIVKRAKARKELEDTGMEEKEIDRLIPLKTEEEINNKNSI